MTCGFFIEFVKVQTLSLLLVVFTCFNKCYLRKELKAIFEKAWDHVQVAIPNACENSCLAIFC